MLRTTRYTQREKFVSKMRLIPSHGAFAVQAAWGKDMFVRWSMAPYVFADKLIFVKHPKLPVRVLRKTWVGVAVEVVVSQVREKGMGGGSLTE